jgi:hypothetical protein
VTPLLADARSDIPQSATGKEARTEMVSELGEALRAVAPFMLTTHCTLTRNPRSIGRGYRKGVPTRESGPRFCTKSGTWHTVSALPERIVQQTEPDR